MGRLFVFDLDDTLIDNVHDYAEPILDACRLIVKVLGSKAPHVSKIMAMEQEIDKRRVNEVNPATGGPYKYSMERFPGSLVEAYREICKRADVEPDEDVAVGLYETGLHAFDESRYAENIDPNALEVVQFLWNEGNVLALVSKGDERVQQKKLSALKRAGVLERFFIVKIVEDKSPDVFDEVRDLADVVAFKTAPYSVGNSYESDIQPALEVGFRGIWIPVETWDVIGRMDEVKAKMDKERCLVFNNLLEIKERYEELV